MNEAITSTPTQQDMSDLWRAASGIADSELAPPLFRRNPANAMLAMQFAQQMELPILTVMQAMYVPKKGARVGFSSEFYLGRLIASKRIVGTIRYETYALADELLDGRLADIEVRARVTDAATGEELEERISMRQALAEGWAKRIRKRDGSGEMPSKYETMGEQMLKKRAATWLIRNHYPDVMQGTQERGEIEDVALAGAAREADAVMVARARAKLPPGTDIVEQPEGGEEPQGEAEPGRETPDQVAPQSRCSEAQEHLIHDWLTQEHIDGRAVQAHLEALGHASAGSLSRDQAQELLDLIEGGEFDAAGV